LTDTIDGKEVTSEELFDVQIEKGKIKFILVRSRVLTADEQ
jgi:hypothetical protein